MLFAILATGVNAAAAQETDETPAVEESRQRFDLATAAFDRGAFAVALTEFERVYALLDGHPRRSYVLYNMARANEELGRHREALAQFDQFLAEAGPEAPNRDEAQRHAGELRLRLQLGGTDAPEGSAGSFSPSSLGIVIASAGAAAILAGGIVGGVALAQDSNARADCDATRCGPDAYAALVDAHSLANAADGLLWGGLGVLAVGIVLTFVLGESPADERPGATCTSEGCSAFVRWRL